MSRKSVGEQLRAQSLEDVRGQVQALWQAGGLSHLQFRRFAGCPVCNLHLHGFAAQAAALQASGVRELVVFHSAPERLLAYAADFPFPLIADPARRLYRAFGVEASPWALLHPRSWWAAGLQGVLAHGLSLPGRGESVLGLPADFLIDETGRILALKYGRHADDQWTLAELLALAATARKTPELG